EPLDKPDSYKLVARLQAENGKYADVLKTIERMEKRYHRIDVYESVFESRIGKDPAEVFDLALAVISRPAEKTNIAFRRVTGFAAIASVQSKTGRDATRAFDLALETIEQLSDLMKKVQACTLVASVQEDVGVDTTKTYELVFNTVERINDWKEKA